MLEERIMCFEGRYRFLSNFYLSPFVTKETKFTTVEHYYQAAKAANLIHREKIIMSNTPQDAKKLGQRCQLVANWEGIKLTVMETGMNYKFAQNKYLADKLLETGDAYIEEGNMWHDNYWGRCYCRRCEGAGYNHLGRLLMKIREEIKELI